MITIIILLAIQQSVSSPLFFTKMFTKYLKEASSEASSLANLNGMIVIDKMAEQLEKCPEFANTSVSKNFKNMAYATLQLPSSLAKDVVVAGVDNLEKAVEEYETTVKETIAEKDTSDNKDGKNGDDAPTENVDKASPSDGSNSDDSLPKVPDPVNENIAKVDMSSGGTDNQKKDVETQIEPSVIKKD